MVIKFDKVLDDIKIADYNNRKIVLSTQKGEPIRFQIPKMYMPFGISGFTPEIGNKKWNIDFSMRGYDENDSIIKRCYDVLRKIEEKIITNVAEQSEDIFGKKMTYDELLPLFNSNIKETPGREPKFRVKVDTDYEGRIKPLIYDQEKKDIRCEAEDGLHSRTTGSSIVELNSVYFMNKKFGCTWKLYQLMVSDIQRLKGFQIMIDDDHD
jgi:hypothetical protein